MRKIAGKTLAKPLTSGIPIDEKITASPIATDAIRPLLAKTNPFGLFFPFGAGVAFQVKPTPNSTSNKKPIIPSTSPDSPTELPKPIALMTIIIIYN